MHVSNALKLLFLKRCRNHSLEIHQTYISIFHFQSSILDNNMFMFFYIFIYSYLFLYFWRKFFLLHSKTFLSNYNFYDISCPFSFNSICWKYSLKFVFVNFACVTNIFNLRIKLLILCETRAVVQSWPNLYIFSKTWHGEFH